MNKYQLVHNGKVIDYCSAPDADVAEIVFQLRGWNKGKTTLNNQNNDHEEDNAGDSGFFVSAFNLISDFVSKISKR